MIAWSIDDVQLFLLKHFPAVSGVSGILKGHNNIQFSNRSRRLGAYGLLYGPGEMIFASAPLIAYFMKKKKSVNSKDLIFSPVEPRSAGMRALDSRWCYSLRSCIWPPSAFCSSRSVCGNTAFSIDIHDFISAWTQLNVGEVVFSDGMVLDQFGAGIATAMIREVLGGQIGDLLPDIPEYDITNSEANLGVFVYLVDVSE